MALTIFYSWQSDLPNRTNRSFIERALEKAIGTVAETLEVVEAERGELVLDKDTKGIPGIPPIADVIFEKISKAAVFVPDLTFVGKSSNGRRIPNPNVLIEYGWALKVLGHSRIVPIMNAAYGEPNAENLPFDMRHLRRPITYCVPDDIEDADRRSIRDSLAKELASAIRLVLESKSFEKEPDKYVFKETPSTTTPSTFLKPGELLGVVADSERELHIPVNEHMFLRLIPSQPTEPISSSKAALGLIHSGRLQPMRDGGGSFTSGRNSYGAFTCSPDKDQVLHVTQLFKNRELWGIDTRCIDKQSRMSWTNVDFGYFPCVAFEDTFKLTLANYLEFAEKALQLPPPLRIIAGATNVEGYRMTAPTGLSFAGLEQFGGRVVEPHIVYEGTIESYQRKASQILRPFFNQVWEECGLERPDKANL